jgi:hypothetical protein
MGSDSVTSAATAHNATTQSPPPVSVVMDRRAACGRSAAVGESRTTLLASPPYGYAGADSSCKSTLQSLHVVVSSSLPGLDVEVYECAGDQGHDAGEVKYVQLTDQFESFIYTQVSIPGSRPRSQNAASATTGTRQVKHPGRVPPSILPRLPSKP